MLQTYVIDVSNVLDICTLYEQLPNEKNVYSPDTVKVC